NTDIEVRDRVPHRLGADLPDLEVRVAGPDNRRRTDNARTTGAERGSGSTVPVDLAIGTEHRRTQSRGPVVLDQGHQAPGLNQLKLAVEADHRIRRPAERDVAAEVPV